MPISTASVVGARTLFPNIYEITPDYVPNSATDLYVGDVWVQELIVTNNSTSDVTITVTDKQGTPLPLFKNFNVTGSAGTADTVLISSKGIFCAGGISVSASASSALILRGRLAN